MQKYVFIPGILLIIPFTARSQEPPAVPETTAMRISIPADDSIASAIDPTDPLNFRALRDSTVTGDSLTSGSDTIKASSSSQALDAPVKYKSTDSIVYSLSNKKVYLYNKSNIQYNNIILDADYIEFDMTNETVFAEGVPDSTGTLQGKPVFAEGSEKFESQTLYYNFRTKKGLIKEIFTEQEGGYLHSSTTKRHPNEHIHIKNGKYTTCDAPHPHYYIALTKAVSIPNDKIVSGPAYIVVADVPLPIGIPFGFFPNTKTNKSGILMPQYGEESRRGYFLRNGGYYLAASKYFDLKLQGDIYTNGTWAASLGSNYRARYRFSGNLMLKYAQNITGEKGIPEAPKWQESGYSKSKDFAINWSHNKDPKSNPNQSFRASVNFSTASYDRNHTRNINNVMQSTKQSSINYSRVWPNSPFNLSGSLNANQNSQTKQIGLKSPQMSLNMNRIYPFRRKNKTGKTRFWEDLQLSYTSSLENRLDTHEDDLFNSTWDDFDKAYQHNIPASLSLKALNFFTIAPSVRYTGVLFTNSINPQYIEDYVYPNTDIRTDTFLIDTIPGLKYAHAYVPSISVNFSPKIYGTFQFRPQSKIEAIRHVMTPNASFSYVPDMAGKVPNYYQEVVIDSLGNTREYGLFDQSIYRIPVPSGRSGSVNLSLRNNIEMKLKPDSDTIDEFKKVKLLDNLSFTTNYGIFKDSLKWNPIRMNGNTRFFKNRLSLKFGGVFDPYDYVESTTGRYSNINRSLYKGRGQLLRMSSFDFAVGTSFKSGQGETKTGAAGSLEDQGNDPTARTERPPTYFEDDIYYGGYVDFNIPWSFSADYNFRYNKQGVEPDIVQSVRFRGDFSLTPNWKIGFNSGYDFKAKKMSTTNLSVYRDLHCWEMNVTIVPFGYFRSYSFQINIKSAVLRDLKYEKGDNWYDNF